jgi:hypothetical protein
LKERRKWTPKQVQMHHACDACGLVSWTNSSSFAFCLDAVTLIHQLYVAVSPKTIPTSNILFLFYFFSFWNTRLEASTLSNFQGEKTILVLCSQKWKMQALVVQFCITDEIVLEILTSFPREEISFHIIKNHFNTTILQSICQPFKIVHWFWYRHTIYPQCTQYIST